MYEDMVFIRLTEETMAARYAEQEMRCPVHLSVGQEATAVGVCKALRASDKVFSTHRCHAHYLAKGGDLNAMLAEIYGKAAGCCGGRGGSMHLFDPEVGMELSVPIVGSSIPLAVGAALAARQRGLDQVSVPIVGDAAIEEGVFYESMNFAALRRLPVVFACENNLFSIYTRIDERQPGRPVADLAKAHGIPSATIDGNDVEAVFAATSEAVARARAGEGPSFLVFETYRWREHCGPSSDNHIGYRAESEFESWAERCPLKRAKAKLIAADAIDEAGDAALVRRLQKRVDEAFDFARAAPLPAAETASLHVYA
jgi:pyruvate dehydrogenase E1 component alpha subunit